MPKHYNPTLSEELGRRLDLKVGDSFNSNSVNNPSPTFSVLSRITRITTITSSSTGGATIYTTPAGKDYFLKRVFYHFLSSAAADNTSITVSIIINNATVNFIAIQKPSLTAQELNGFLDFGEEGILVDRSSAIATSTAFTAGAVLRDISIFGTEIETSKAHRQ